MDEIFVTFYFISGTNLHVSFTKEKFNELIKLLSKSFDCNVIGNESGINFAHVTHYIVKK